MIALTIVLVGLALMAAGVSSKRNADRVVAEIRAAEQRGIERERNRGLDAGIAAFDKLGVTR